jgi:hypothetical protein
VPTGVDARLARLAVTTLLLQTTAPAADADPPQGLSVELAGVHSAGNAAGANREPVRIVRCTLGGGGAPTVQVTGDVLPGMPDGALDAVLRAAGIHRDADALILRFPAPGR